MKITFFIQLIAILLCNGLELQLFYPIDSKLNIDIKDVHPCHGPKIKSCELVSVDAKAFNGNIKLPGGRILRKVDEWTSGKSASYTYNDNKGEVIFVEKNGRVAGEAGEFVLEPCNNFDGCHVWKQLKVKDFVDEVVHVEPGSRRRILRRQSDTTTIVVFSVKIYYTRQFAAVTDDIGLFISLIAYETNKGYFNSGIPLRMEVQCVEGANLDDIDDSSTMLMTFMNYKSSAAELRGSADAAALLVSEFSGCGIAWTDVIGNGLTFSVTQKSCATGYYTFGHELAHNFGAYHNREQYQSPTGYNYGKLISPQGSGYRTIMAYSADGHKRRVNYYSNPNVTLTLTGTPTGSTLENNARVLIENRFAMAAIGDESISCNPPGTSWSDDMGWCSHAGHELHVGDFNGDKRVDLLCHDTKGKKWISYASKVG